jgi:septum formation protein
MEFDSKAIRSRRPLYAVRTPLVLASGSPRRKRLLEALGLEFEVEASGVEESAVEGPVDQAVLTWAGEKARAVAERHPDRWVLSADTVVVLEGEMLGKPADPEEARRMLGRLSGRAHDVISGLCLKRRDLDVQRVTAVTTRVIFRNLDPAEITAYVTTGEPLDKAGAYGIQGLGAALVKAVQGSYTNVVGLPLAETLEWLLAEGIVTAR